MDMAHAVAIHVQTEPDTEYTLHIIVILMDEISPFLWGDHAADIEDRPVQKKVLGGLVFLNFDVDDNLCKAILHADVKDDVKADHTFIDLAVLSVEANELVSGWMGVAGICHTGFNRNNTDQWFSFDAWDNVFRLHAFKFINRLYQYIGKYQLLCDQLLGVFVILRLIVGGSDSICNGCVHISSIPLLLYSRE